MLKGKVIVNFGDSIFGNFRAPEDISSYLSDITGAKTYNVAFGGCRMGEHKLPQFDRFSMYRLASSVVSRDFSLQDESFSYEPIGEALPDYFKGSLETLKSIDFRTVDIITIAYGTNDYTAKMPLDNANDRCDIKSFGGALRYSIETLREAFPKIKIVICSQLYRFWRDSDGNFTEDSDTRVLGGHKFSDFMRKTKEIADEYGLYYLDNYNGSGICKKNIDVCFSKTDGSHPLPAGRIMIAQNMAKELAVACSDKNSL